MRVNNLVRLFTLLLLSKGPKHGYEIIKELGEKLGKKPSAGQIYPFLKSLRKKGYIESKGVGEREKRVYYLTREGEKFVEGIFLKFDSLIKFAIKSKVKKCVHCGCEIYSGWYKTKIGEKSAFFCCKSCAESFKVG
jgi:DNA-binding PadR family transcriptional regulator